MIRFSHGSKTGKELHDDRSESTNAKSVIRLDIGYITDEVRTQAEMEKYNPIGHIPIPQQSQHDQDKHLFQKLL